MSECWYIPNDIEYRSEENRLIPNQPCSYETLSKLMVFYESHGTLDIIDNIEFFAEALVKEMGYYAFDVITISKEVMHETFDEIAEIHFCEHTHDDDEVRFIIDGEGYFDIRDTDDRWIRMLCKTGDCIVLPGGIYHRFTTTLNQYTMAVRLFQKNPKWVSLNRYDGSGEECHMRYLTLLQEPLQAAVGPSSEENTDSDSARIYIIPFPLELDAKMDRIARDFIASNGKALVMYLTGRTSPYVGNESWCPDCICAKPLVIAGFNKLCKKLGKENVFFVEVPVEKMSYVKNPDYPLRCHKAIKLQCIPTLFVFAPKPTKLLETAPWWDLLEVKLKTESPNPDEIVGC